MRYNSNARLAADVFPNGVCNTTRTDGRRLPTLPTVCAPKFKHHGARTPQIARTAARAHGCASTRARTRSHAHAHAHHCTCTRAHAHARARTPPHAQATDREVWSAPNVRCCVMAEQLPQALNTCQCGNPNMMLMLMCTRVASKLKLCERTS